MSDLKISTQYREETEELPHAESPEFFSRYFNDLQISSDGDLEILTGPDKLAQDILKMLSTKKGSHPFYSEYGVDFSDLIGKKQLSEGDPYIKAAIKDRLVQGLKELQRNLINNPENEQIGALSYFDAEINQDGIDVKFSVITKSREYLNILYTIEGG